MGFDGLVLLEFSQGVSWEFGVASVLWGRSRGMSLVSWNEFSSGGSEQSWGASGFLFCGGGYSMSSGVPHFSSQGFEVGFPFLLKGVSLGF